MNYKLIELPAEKLLEKFGIGSHVPGSGSAAAFQGMLSAQLILTVINLTLDEKRGQTYQSVSPRLKEISSAIRNRIYPILENLFQKDSEQFHSAIQLRIARDKETHFMRGKELDQKAKEALNVATETLVRIALLCVELGDSAISIFNNGFRSARGDSGVALQGTISAIAGCLSIINLNCLSIDDETLIEDIRISSKNLKGEYERLRSLADECNSVLEREVDEYQSLRFEIKELKAYKLKSQRISNSDIENLAIKVQNILWRYRDTIWKTKKTENPLEVLQPRVAFEKMLGYKVFKRERLDPYNMAGETIEVAGVIDNVKKAVGISTIFSNQIQNFTLAHELGHALLHQQTVLHRDRAVDGSEGGIVRDRIELQADKFATYFLMPEKQIKSVFRRIFFMEKFVLNDDSVFALTGGRLEPFLYKCRNLRELSRTIASAESFYGIPFESIATQFNVSEGAMAIRLEELDLIEYISLPASRAIDNRR